MKISNIVILKVTGQKSLPQYSVGDRQAQQIDIYRRWHNPLISSPEEDKNQDQDFELYVQVESTDGINGIFGPISERQAYIIDRDLKPLLLGKDPLATEALLDMMVRLDRHGRSGVFMTGISPVNCALWDLKGKAWQQPIYRLLGGPTRPVVPAYASMLGYSVNPTQAAEIAREFKEKGFTAQKWFFRYGPAEGQEGMKKNIEMAEAVREAVGKYYPLMFDAFMGWSVDYAVKMVKYLEAVNPTWMEEPIPPEKVGGFKKIKAVTSVPIATGEHVYTRWQVKELLINNAVDVLQTDPDWTGGISELMAICHLASAFDTTVVAHGHSLLAALHVAAAQPATTVPWVEYLIRHQENKQYYHKQIYRPKNGSIKLPELPGLGLILDQEKISQIEQLNFS